MNKLRQTSFKSMAILLCLISAGVYGQKQTKTFNETFNTTSETVLDISTTHTDIEFETWDKNQISIEATVEFDGATDEEMDKYFDKDVFEILGNSKKVTIKTGTENTWLSNHSIVGMDLMNDFDIQVHAFPEMESFHIDLSDIAEMPPLPNTKVYKFDHKAYKKDGDKYMKKWQKNFEKGFDKKYEKKLEEWSKKMEGKSKELENKMEKREEARVQRMEKLAEARVEQAEKRVEARAKIMEKRAEALEKRVDVRVNRNKNNSIFITTDDDDVEPNIFYFSSDGENKNYKVKKTIKVKMPKGMKMKMNVRHGEVKLAENTKNLNAIISHSSLWAAIIDGDQTEIKASYSPVSVQKWNYGQLQVNYSEAVDLKEVGNLRLTSTSSDVTIDRLVNSVYIKNNFGPLKINSVSKNFSDIDISLQNAELDCKIPSTPFTIYVNGTDSELTYPSSVTLNRTQNHNTIVHKGYHINKDGNKSIIINSKYSEVTLD